MSGRTALPGASAPAPAWRAALALARLELLLTARRGENLLVTLVIPAVLLLFFGSTDLLPTGTARPVDLLLPGTLALALIAAGLVNLGIATAYERHYGVLKRLGGSPLPRWGLVAAKIGAVAVVELVQVALLVGLALLALGWRPGPAADPILLLAALLLGTAAFAGLGLAMAGRLRAEATLAGANALFLFLLLAGGTIVPVERLPGPLAAIADLLPAAPLAALLRAGLGDPAGVGSAGPAGPLLVLAAWAAAAVLVAARTFRWD